MKWYSGTFLIAFSMLALEVTLTRYLSVVTWYHLSFFAIATALLGSTAGATLVYLYPDWFKPEHRAVALVWACLGYALVVPLTLIMLSTTPIDFYVSLITPATLLLVTLACALPFFFGGIVTTVMLTKSPLPVNRVYAVDLLGAALGSLFVLGGLELLDAPSLILLCAALGLLAGIAFASGETMPRLRRSSIGLFMLVVVFSLINSTTIYGIRPVVVKSSIVLPGNIYLEKWNSFSRVVVYKPRVRIPMLWGPSSMRPATLHRTYYMDIDGAAGTQLREFHTLDDIEHLRYDVTNVAYYLRPSGGALVIGVGAGKDVQSAVLFGQERIVGVELNPIFIDLLEGEFREFAGIADREEVTLVVDEGRSYAAHTDETFSLIQMSLIDTWAATGAGAFSLSENSLYTVEAWQTFMSRLVDDGIFTVSRWHNAENLGETGRVISLAVAVLLEEGAAKPADHIAMISAGGISTLLISKQPLSAADMANLEQVTAELEYETVIMPGVPPEHPVLRKIVAARSRDELYNAIKNEPLNYAPPTDESPYFFNMLRLEHLSLGYRHRAGVISGNLQATVTLIGLILSLLVVALATIVFPLMVKTRSAGETRIPWAQLWPGASYFALIGAGFMFVEIALIQRLSVFLSHPIYALGVLLFTIIASTGVGSLISERLPLTRAPWVFVYPVVTVIAIIAMRFILTAILADLITEPIPTKILIAIGGIFPIGILLGLFFPTGMRLVRSVNIDDTPWYWALNGVFSVLCSALAVFVSIYIGISANFYLAAGCYSLLLIGVYFMFRATQRTAPVGDQLPVPPEH